MKDKLGPFDRREPVIPGSGELPPEVWSDLAVEAHWRTARWLLEEAGADFGASSLAGFLASIKIDTGTYREEPRIGSNL